MTNFLAIVQVRINSSRFPGKVLEHLDGTPILEWIIYRLRLSKNLNQVVVATGNGSENDAIEELCRQIGVECFRGNERDVLDRYYQAALRYPSDNIVRVTGDCPFVAPDLLDDMIQTFVASELDYLSNVAPPTFPDGIDLEIFSFDALQKCHKEAQEDTEREHVTLYMRQSDEFLTANYLADEDRSLCRWTVDEPADLVAVDAIAKLFSPAKDFGLNELFELKETHPELYFGNQANKRNEGLELCSGQKTWQRAKKRILRGTMLLSKNPDMFLPGQWPSYFSKAKGCSIWDLDGREFVDMSLMGVGTNTLGYGHPQVDEAVLQTVGNGNLSTLNCPEEVELSEKLIDLHPWAAKAVFTRAGGEANAVAIRIARAASGRDKVAICGYHGWHDWYLSSNLSNNSNLEEHLLSGLEPLGVPKAFQDTTLPFRYNDIAALESIIANHEIGVIKMEVRRNFEPEDNFLEKVRKLATDNNIVLVFDECTSGFRKSFGGLHKTYGVNPDVAVFGKTLGNGYAINAVIGTSEVMDIAQQSFVSSTFWTERIGPTAALATLEVMEQLRSWEKITAIGEKVRTGWQQLADKHELVINHGGLASIANFAFAGEDAAAYKTLITQEMLKEGILASTSFYACIAHTDQHIEQYLELLDPIFAKIRECKDGRDIHTLLEGPVCDTGFGRLN